MTPTQIARRSDALYGDNTGSMTRRVLCDMVAQREADLEDARAENTKLRSQCAELIDERERLFHANVEKNGEILRLAGENDKLRELVQDAWGNGHPDRSCGGCDIRDECHDDTERLRKDGMLRFSRCLFELRIEDRMRELGIEVDE